MPPMCQICGARKTASGARLRLCSGCKIDHYCSQACQTADWPRHKVHCRHVRKQERDEPVHQRIYAAMDAWAKKHQDSMLSIALTALNAYVEPSVGAHTVFMLDVRRRPGETRPERLFDVLDAYAHPMAWFGEADRARYRALYEEEDALRGKRHAGDRHASGLYLLCIREVDTNTVLATPLTFFVYVVADASTIPWKEAFLRCLNEGRVCRGVQLLEEIVNADIRRMRLAQAFAAGVAASVRSKFWPV